MAGGGGRAKGVRGEGTGGVGGEEGKRGGGGRSLFNVDNRWKQMEGENDVIKYSATTYEFSASLQVLYICVCSSWLCRKVARPPSALPPHTLLLIAYPVSPPRRGGCVRCALSPSTSFSARLFFFGF